MPGTAQFQISSVFRTINSVMMVWMVNAVLEKIKLLFHDCFNGWINKFLTTRIDELAENGDITLPPSNCSTFDEHPIGFELDHGLHITVRMSNFVVISILFICGAVGVMVVYGIYVELRERRVLPS